MGKFVKGQIIELPTKPSCKPSRVVIRVDELMPQLSDAELVELRERMERAMLIEGTPDQKREVLSRMSACPTCGHGLLGHNQAPDDHSRVYRRQGSFKFDNRGGRGS
jgi:hypothetical protein